MKNMINTDAIKTKLFVASNLPLLNSISPKISFISLVEAEVRIKNRWWTRSFRRSLSFGAIAMGAECAAGCLFGKYITDHNVKNGWVINACTMKLMRPFKNDAVFHISLDKSVEQYILQCTNSKENVDVPVSVTGTTQQEVCALFTFNVRLQPPRD